MIITKTPLRISFVGGGSDLEAFYKHSDGAVVSVAIDQHIYITVNKKFDDKIRLNYSQTEDVECIDDIEHNLIRETLRKLGGPTGIEIHSMGDIPSKGSGLGSSSTFTVGLLHALHAYRKEFSTPESLGEESCEIEIGILKEPIGKQDQYAAAYGGLNFIQFYSDGSVSVDPIICSKETRKGLERNILVFYTGITRSASKILEKQRDNTANEKKKFETMKRMVKLAHALKDELQKNNLDVFGRILHENWMLKKEMADGISTPEIDHWYQKGIDAGALGGKILGAGGGGFLLFYAHSEDHPKIIEELSELRPMKMDFDYQGSRIIFIH